MVFYYFLLFIEKQITSFQFFPFVQEFELLILMKLKWDILSITPVDFVDQFLYYLGLSSEDSAVARKHSNAFIHFCCTGMVECTCSRFSSKYWTAVFIKFRKDGNQTRAQETLFCIVCCISSVYISIYVTEWFCRSLINVTSVRSWFGWWVC